MNHKIKIKQKYYDAIFDGSKTFEIRKNDRDYQVDDTIYFLILKEDGTTSLATDVYKITYVLKNVEEYGLNKDYCIFSFIKL